MTNKAYYYLVAGLPDITLHDKRSTDELRSAVEEATERVHRDDRRAIHALRYTYDNQNLLLQLFPREDAQFNPLGNFSAQLLAQEIKHPDTLPEYMISFIQAYNGGNKKENEGSWEDTFASFFYEEMCSHSSCFVRDWYTFDLNLRNVLSAINCRKHPKGAENKYSGYSVEHSIIGTDEIARQLKKSSAQDFGLTSLLPWIETVLNFPEQLDQREERIDLFRWDMLDSMCEGTFFGIELILSFIIKLGIIQRWQNLDTERGKEMLETLTERLTSEFSLPQEME